MIPYCSKWLIIVMVTAAYNTGNDEPIDCLVQSINILVNKIRISRNYHGRIITAAMPPRQKLHLPQKKLSYAKYL